MAEVFGIGNEGGLARIAIQITGWLANNRCPCLFVTLSYTPVKRFRAVTEP